MIRKMKVLALAGLAVFAVSAIAAQAAHATAQIHIHIPEGKNAQITAVSTNSEFVVESGVVKCTSTVLEKTVPRNGSPTTLTELTLTPTFSGCKAFGLNTTIDPNGCEIGLKATETVENNPDVVTADAHVSCAAGKAIEITAPGCKVTVGTQAGLSHVILTNTNTSETEKRDVDGNVTIGNITYTEPAGESCAKPGTRATGSFKGTFTIQAFEDASTEKEPHAHGTTPYGTWVS